MKSSIDKIRSKKNNKVLIIDGINYGRVIAIETYDISIKSIAKELIKLFVFNYKINITGNKNSNICLFYSLRSANRSDYNYIINLFKESITDVKFIDLIAYKSVTKIFRKIILLIKNIVKFKLNNVDDAIISSIVATRYMILNKEINKKDLFKGINLLCTFCDAHGADNLVTQIANNNNITTVTLQHGQYRILSNGNEIADAEAYENFISDYMLTWGQATIDEFKKVGISQNRLIRAGALKPFSFNNKKQIQKDTNMFGVILSGEIYRESNIKIIKLANEIAKKYNKTYCLRLHPKNNSKIYMKYCDTNYLSEVICGIENWEYIEKVEFSLIFMTGVFVELLSYNSPIFIYQDSNLEDVFKIEHFCVKSIKEFDDIYEQYMHNKKEFLKKQYDKYHYFNEAGNITENYKDAIQYILENIKRDDGDLKNESYTS